MKTEKYILLYFFNDLIKIALVNPHKRGWGNPCSHMIEELILRQDHFIQKIVERKPHCSGEYRLNGAGLKMYWENRTGFNDDIRFVCSIGGDQADEYPEFVEAARKYIKERGCAKWHE